jgi:hypothetical protein
MTAARPASRSDVAAPYPGILLAADADVHNMCEVAGVTFDLTGLAERIRMRAADWQSLSVSWTERGISPNYGKAMTSASFEWEGWLGVISVWETGETDLLTARTSGDSGVNKHYDLEDAAQLNVVLSELIGLIRYGSVPPDAFTYAAP